VIGVIFFGLLGTQSAAAAHSVDPQLRSGLAAASVPASYTNRIVGQFSVCLHDRLVASDPTVTPAACKPPAAERQVLSPGVTTALAKAGKAAVRHDFVASVERTLWFQVGTFLLSFLLMFALPGRGGRRHADEAGSQPDQATTTPGGEVLAATDGAVNV
jgi:hypothetical protein